MKILGILLMLLGVSYPFIYMWPVIESEGFINLGPVLIGLMFVPIITNIIIGISIIKNLLEKYIHIMFFIMYICMMFSWSIRSLIYFIPFHIVYLFIKRKGYL